jgi:hypothetical protein
MNATAMSIDRELGPWLAPLTLLIFLALLTPGFVALAVDLSTRHFTQAEPAFVESVRQQVLRPRGLPGDVVTLLAEVFPALAVAICFRRDSAGARLSRSGRFAFGLLVCGFAASIWGVSVIDASDPRQAENFVDGADALEKLDAWSERTLRTCLTYLLLLLGLRVK